MADESSFMKRRSRTVHVTREENDEFVEYSEERDQEELTYTHSPLPSTTAEHELVVDFLTDDRTERGRRSESLRSEIRRSSAHGAASLPSGAGTVGHLTSARPYLSSGTTQHPVAQLGASGAGAGPGDGAEQEQAAATTRAGPGACQGDVRRLHTQRLRAGAGAH